jgi:hypothetical protein
MVVVRALALIMIFEDGQVCDSIDGCGGSRGAGHGGQMCEPQKLLLPLPLAPPQYEMARSSQPHPALHTRAGILRDFGAFLVIHRKSSLFRLFF